MQWVLLCLSFLLVSKGLTLSLYKPLHQVHVFESGCRVSEITTGRSLANVWTTLFFDPPKGPISPFGPGSSFHPSVSTLSCTRQSRPLQPEFGGLIAFLAAILVISRDARVTAQDHVHPFILGENWPAR